MSEDESTARLMLRLRALASPARLALLNALVTPSRAADIRVQATGERAGLGAERYLGRSTIIEHLGVLEDAGLVRRIGELYAVDQQGMVALLQDLGQLARLRALVEVDVEVTRESATPFVQPIPAFPRVLLANGPEAGRAIVLAGSGPWRIGRGAECEIPLAHDPHVSRLHASLTRENGEYALHVQPTAKNPVFADFARIDAGASAKLRSCAILLVGATLLGLQP